MKLLEINLEQSSNENNPFGIQLDAPMQKSAVNEAGPIKPRGFPMDSRGYYSPEG